MPACCSKPYTPSQATLRVLRANVLHPSSLVANVSSPLLPGCFGPKRKKPLKTQYEHPKVGL